MMVDVPNRRFLDDQPTALRWLVIGALAMGIPGCVAGLVVGLFVYPPTAWFALFELGVPAAVLGGLIGLSSAGVAAAVRGARRAA